MRLTISVFALAASFAASADTIAWWHFDECEPGTTAPANTVASDQAPTTYAHVYTVGNYNTMSALSENGGDYLPVYTKPFRGLAVYDPVSDTTRTNNAVMKFRIDRGGSAANTNAGRARFGGGQFFDGWMDDIRVTRRALTPDEFLATHPVGSGDASMIALFEQSYDFTSPEIEALSAAGIGEARTGGNAGTTAS